MLAYCGNFGWSMTIAVSFVVISGNDLAGDWRGRVFRFEQHQCYHHDHQNKIQCQRRLISEFTAHSR